MSTSVLVDVILLNHIPHHTAACVYKMDGLQDLLFMPIDCMMNIHFKLSQQLEKLLLVTDLPISIWLIALDVFPTR